MSKADEIWKDIKGYEKLYQISNKGRIKSLERKTFKADKYGQSLLLHKEKILTNNIMKSGYSMITLYKSGKPKSYFIHRLVAQAFIPNPNNYKEINHIDKDRKNNNVNNLEWCTRAYNNAYSKAKAVNQYNLQGKFIKTWESAKQAAEENNIYRSNITSCCKGKAKTTGGFMWKYA